MAQYKYEGIALNSLLKGMQYKKGRETGRRIDAWFTRWNGAEGGGQRWLKPRDGSGR